MRGQKTKIVNLTPNPITIFSHRDVKLHKRTSYCLKDQYARPKAVYEPEGLAWATVSIKQMYKVDGVPVVKTIYGPPVGLPEPQPDTIYLVSYIVGLAARQSGRTTDDLLITDGMVRDNAGNIIGCIAFRKCGGE